MFRPGPVRGHAGHARRLERGAFGASPPAGILEPAAPRQTRRALDDAPSALQAVRNMEAQQ